jgi:hypothetical protein
VLSEAQREIYHRDGWLMLCGIVPASTCAAVGDALWRALEAAHGIRRDAPETWRLEYPRRLTRYLHADDFAALACPALIELLDDLLGSGTWPHPRVWAQPLPLFPAPGPWDVPARMWHLDYPVRGRRDHGFAVKVLCLLTDVAPQGGGTLLVEGSHRLMSGYAAGGICGSSARMRRRLCQDQPWFRALMSADGNADDRVRRFMVEGAVVDDVPVRVAEVTGSSGDLVLFHPWLLHNVSANRRAEPRMLVGQSFTTRDGLQIYRPDPD